jgi:hypothetical protein
VTDLLIRAIPWLLAAVAATIYHFAVGGELNQLKGTILAALIGVICALLGNGIAEGVREGLRKRLPPGQK